MTAEAQAARGCVLVAEDDAELRAAVVAALGARFPDARVLETGDGCGAWSALAAGGVDVLLADIAMPGMTGLELVRRARREESLADLYVILITGVATPEALFAAMDDGADDCLLKPCRWDELTVRVGAGLRRVGANRRQAARQRQLEQLYERQSEFLSLVSHEIRTPLAGILSAANILRRYGSQRPDSVERFATVIHQEGRRLTRLINNLLDLAKIEAGQVEWELAPTALDALVERVRESFESLLGERNLTLEVAPAGEPIVAELDADKVTQVLVNLLANSIQHSPDGARVWLRYAARPDGGLRLEVEDEGTGIPPGAEERIFDRFQQASPSESRGGSGLGLTISRQIVEHHGGRIWAEPNRERGAMFVVELPAARGEGRDGPVR